MPTYEYRCSACGHEFERFETISAQPTKACPECNQKTAMRKISGGAGFLFKGAGFYATDYRSSSYKEAAKKESTPAPAPSCATCSESKSCPAANTTK